MGHQDEVKEPVLINSIITNVPTTHRNVINIAFIDILGRSLFSDRDEEFESRVSIRDSKQARIIFSEQAKSSG